MSPIPHLLLNDGHPIPQLGFGTYQIAPSETSQAVGQALKVGYRHVDTAQMYRNEAGVGQAIRTSGIPRDELFVTSKLNNDNHAPDRCRASFQDTLQALGMDYVDLFLIHWPLPTRYGGDFVATWRVLEEFRASGQARSVGVSNFQPEHLQRIFDHASVVPAVNQIEAHPYMANANVVAFNRAHGVVTQAWPPVARGALLQDPEIQDIAASLQRTPAQVVLRWHIQRGYVIFPKTVTPSRMEENYRLFDFELTPEAMSRISGLDRGPSGRIGPDPDTFDWIP